MLQHCLRCQLTQETGNVKGESAYGGTGWHADFALRCGKARPVAEGRDTERNKDLIVE